MSVGLHIMTPTSIVVAGSGSTASIRPDGGVNFSAATSLSLNGVFTAVYDDYMVVMRHNGPGGSQNVDYRLRASGSDAAGSNYVSQILDANTSSVTGSRTTATVGGIAAFGNSVNVGFTASFYGPSLSQATAVRSLCMFAGASGVILRDYSSTHSLTTAYDGFTLIPTASSITGVITVYGLAQ